MVYQLVLGVIIVTVSLMWLVFPPQKINNLYGYRTKRSMSDDEAWRFANKYSAQLMIAFGLITTAVGLLSHFMGWSFWIPVILGMSLLVLLMVLTEYQLKKKFE